MAQKFNVTEENHLLIYEINTIRIVKRSIYANRNYIK